MPPFCGCMRGWLLVRGHYRGTYLYFIVEYAFLNKLNMYEVAMFTLQMKISINNKNLMVKYFFLYCVTNVHCTTGPCINQSHKYTCYFNFIEMYKRLDPPHLP